MANYNINLEAFSWAGVTEEQARKLAGDASTRLYYRVRHKSRPAILMIFQEDELSRQQSVRFEEIQAWLKNLQIPVPEILKVSEDRRFYLLEDLDDLSMETWLAQPKNQKEIIRQYRILMEYIHEMQKTPLEEMLSEVQPLAKERLLWELNYFHQYYFDNREDDKLHAFYEKIATESSKCEMKAAHRDYHCRNVMMHQNKLYLIDFQDARWAHPLYDAVSLLYDAYHDPGEEVRSELLKDEDDLSDLCVVALQRNLKAVGTFAYQTKVRGKVLYGQFIPRCLGYVRQHLETLGWDREMELLEGVKT